MSRDSGRLFFDVLGSPRTTVSLASALLALLSVGLVVPQGIAAEGIGYSYSASLAQVITALELHRVVTSWPVQLVLVGLALNGGARLIEAGLSHRASAPLPRDVAAALVGWRVRAAADGSVRATRGLFREGLIVLLVGGFVLGGATLLATGATSGRLFVLTGGDDAARSRYVAEELRGERWVPWKPGFELTCSESSDQELLGPRQCIVDIGGRPHQATLVPRRDLEFEGKRLTLVGVRRVSGVEGFGVDVGFFGGSAQPSGAIGTPIDVRQGDRLVATLLPSGNAPHDPIGVLPSPDSDAASALTVSVRPRVMLEIAVHETGAEPWTWAGVTLVLIGLSIAGLLPGYRATLTRHDGRWMVDVQGVGLLSRGEPLQQGLNRALGQGAS